MNRIKIQGGGFGVYGGVFIALRRKMNPERNSSIELIYRKLSYLNKNGFNPEEIFKVVNSMPGGIVLDVKGI